MIKPFLQRDFSGGMNLFDDPAQLALNEYRLGQNIRNRARVLEAVKSSERLTNAPSGKKQGIFGFENYLLLFNDGQAWYYNEVINTWTQITSFQMNSLVERIYTQFVSSSTMNFERRLRNAAIINGTAADSKVDLYNTKITTSDAGVVCQDGTNQPLIILPDATCLTLKTYVEWIQNGERAREYVPVGYNMASIDGITFIVAPDKKRLIRSVAGRPIDFVINVSSNGNKGGDANTTDYAVSYDTINCIYPLKTGELYVGNSNYSYLIDLDYENLIFAQPTFKNIKPRHVGIINQNCIAELIGDYAIIDGDGIRSLAAVSEFSASEGRNLSFVQKIGSKLFKGIRQTNNASCIKFQDYVFFAVLTIYGHKILVYDTLNNSWPSLDSLPGISPVKQFAITRQSSNPKLYCIDADYVYKLYDGANNASAYVITRSNFALDLNSQLKTSSIKIAARNVSTVNASIQVTEQVNEKDGMSQTKTLASNTDKIDLLNFPYQYKANYGLEVATKVQWQNNAEIIGIQIDADETTTEVSQKEKAKTIAG